MTHYPILVIVPNEVVEEDTVLDYIQVMAPYSQDLVVPPWIKMTRDELEQEYRQLDSKFDISAYARRMEYTLDEDGNVIETYNPNTLYDYYEIGGRWDNFLHTGVRQSQFNRLQGNIVWVRQVMEDKQEQRPIFSEGHPDIIIGMDGRVHKEFQKIMNENLEHYVVILDAHV